MPMSRETSEWMAKSEPFAVNSSIYKEKIGGVRLQLHSVRRAGLKKSRYRRYRRYREAIKPRGSSAKREKNYIVFSKRYEL